MKEFTMVEFIKAAPGKTPELREALKELVPHVRSGHGCLQYDLLEPVARSGEFLVLARWRDVKDLQRHEESERIQEFIRKYDGILYTDVEQTEWKAT